MKVHALLAIVIGTWGASLMIAGAALVLAVVNPLRRFRLLLSLAGAAIGLGYLGFGRWTPFSFFPQIGYTWSSGEFRISLSSSWFFLVPIVMGATALLIGMGQRKKMRRG